VLTDKNITSRVPSKQLEHAFDLKRQLRNIDKIFARVFREKKNTRRGQQGRAGGESETLSRQPAGRRRYRSRRRP